MSVAATILEAEEDWGSDPLTAMEDAVNHYKTNDVDSPEDRVTLTYIREAAAHTYHEEELAEQADEQLDDEDSVFSFGKIGTAMTMGAAANPIGKAVQPVAESTGLPQYLAQAGEIAAREAPAIVQYAPETGDPAWFYGIGVIAGGLYTVNYAASRATVTSMSMIDSDDLETEPAQELYNRLRTRYRADEVVDT